MHAKKYPLFLLTLLLLTLGACKSTSRTPKPCNCSKLWYSYYQEPADDLAILEKGEE
jgi:hypothetical protein